MFKDCNVEVIVDENMKSHYGRQPLRYAKEGDAAVDLRAARSVTLLPGATILMGTGIRIHMGTPAIAACILPRSGTGSRGLILGNTQGLIDSGYQGELLCCLWNRSKEEFVISEGDKIAQMMFIPVVRPHFRVVDEFTTESERGSSGFGSTDKDPLT